jgi:hypothetical protein
MLPTESPPSWASRVAGVRWWSSSRGLSRHVAIGCVMCCVMLMKQKILTSSKNTRFGVDVGNGGWRTEGSQKQSPNLLSDDGLPHLVIADRLMMGDFSGHEPKKCSDPLWARPKDDVVTMKLQQNAHSFLC